MSGTGGWIASKIIGALLASAGTSPFVGIDIPLGEISAIVAPAQGVSAELHWQNGEAIGQWRSQSALRVDLDKLPEHFIHAVLAAEDARFFDHGGIDVRGLVSASLDTARGKQRGGSGIAQQLVKLRMAGSQVTLERKIIEAIIATRLTDSVSHDTILSAYLETAWFGRGETGVSNAPRAWFGKDWNEVSIAESALLAALLKGAGLHDPVRHPDRAMSRRNHILDQMLKNGWISSEDHEEARATAIMVTPQHDRSANPGLWISGVIEDLSPGLSGAVDLTLNKEWQDILDQEVTSFYAGQGHQALGAIDPQEVAMLAAREDGSLRRTIIQRAPAGPGAERLILTEKAADGIWDALAVAESGPARTVQVRAFPARYKPQSGDILIAADWDGDMAIAAGIPDTQLAGVIMDSASGKILAILGGEDLQVSAFNRARAQRQPGSVIKPFLYLAGLEAGLGRDYPLVNERLAWHLGTEIWQPSNFPGSNRDPSVSLYRALEHSLNIPTVDLAMQIGMQPFMDMAISAGVWPSDAAPRPVPSLVLGSGESTVIAMTAAYATLLNGGTRINPTLVDGPTVTGERIASAEAIDQLISMLHGVTKRGTASEAFKSVSMPLAGKTGTSQDYRDAWFIGGTPAITIGIWIGKDDNAPMSGVTGGKAAAPIAARVLNQALGEGLLLSNGLYPHQSVTLSWPPELTGAGRHYGTRTSEQRISGPFEADISDGMSYFDEINENFDLLPSLY